jgi:hypothetical protein
MRLYISEDIKPSRRFCLRVLAPWWCRKYGVLPYFLFKSWRNKCVSFVSDHHCHVKLLALWNVEFCVFYSRLTGRSGQGTTLLVGRSRDRSPVVSLGIFSVASDNSMCPGSTQPLEMSTRILLGVKTAGA